MLRSSRAVHKQQVATKLAACLSFSLFVLTMAHLSAAAIVVMARRPSSSKFRATFGLSVCQPAREIDSQLAEGWIVKALTSHQIDLNSNSKVSVSRRVVSVSLDSYIMSRRLR